MILKRFNSANILSSLALETGTVNYNLIINNVSTLLQPLLLGAVKILCHVTRYKLLREKESSLHILLIYRRKRSRINTFIPASFNGTINCSFFTVQKIILKFNVFFVCLFAGDDVKTNDFVLYFCKVFWYKGFCKKLYFGYYNLFIRKNLLQRYLLERIKSLVGYLQFMVEQKHNLVGHLILPRIFPVRQNVRYVFHLVGQFLILVWNCPMSDRYFKAWIAVQKLRKMFLSHLNSSFCSQDIEIFASWSSRSFPPVSHCFRGWSK